MISVTLSIVNSVALFVVEFISVLFFFFLLKILVKVYYFFIYFFEVDNLDSEQPTIGQWQRCSDPILSLQSLYVFLFVEDRFLQ